MGKRIWLKVVGPSYVEADFVNGALDASRWMYPQEYRLRRQSEEFIVLYEPGRHYFGGTGRPQAWASSQYHAARRTGKTLENGFEVEILYSISSSRGQAKRSIRECLKFIYQEMINKSDASDE